MNSRNRTYSNGTITVVWQPAECIHAGECFTTLRKVFDPSKRPWVQLDGASTEEIIGAIEMCPSRALTFYWNDPQHPIPGKEHSPKLFDTTQLARLFPQSESEGSAAVTDGAETLSTTSVSDTAAQAPKTRIVYRPGCPLVIEGEFTLIDENGAPIHPQMKMVSLCRCGHSDNQPFCDGAHFKAGFRR